MSDGEIQVDAGTGGIYVDTSVVSTGEGSVNRQRVAIGDASAAEQFLAIGSDGAASVHVLNNPASVSVINPTSASVNILGGTVTANQGGSLWTVDAIQQGSWGASVSNFPAVQSVSQSGAWTASVQGQLPVTQATSPWLVSQSGSPWGASVQGSTGRTWDLNSATDSVTAVQGTIPWGASVTGTVVANQGNAPWTVDAIQQGNWGASVTQGTSPWVTSGTSTVSGSVSAIQAGAWSTVVSGSVTAIPYGTQTVAGSVGVTNFPGSFIVNQGTTPWAASVQGQVGVAGSVQILPSSSDIGYVGTWPTSGPITGQTSSSVKAVPITTNSYPTTNGILIQGLSTNIASVFVGSSTVASVGPTGGFEIQAGQAVPQTCGNANLVYIIGPNNADGVCWTVL